MKTTSGITPSNLYSRDVVSCEQLNVLFAHLLQVLADEDKVDAAEAELGDAEEDVGHDPGEARAGGPLQPGRGRGEEAGGRHVRVGQVRGARPPAQLLPANMYAMFDHVRN